MSLEHVVQTRTSWQSLFKKPTALAMWYSPMAKYSFLHSFAQSVPIFCSKVCIVAGCRCSQRPGLCPSMKVACCLEVSLL